MSKLLNVKNHLIPVPGRDGDVYHIPPGIHDAPADEAALPEGIRLLVSDAEPQPVKAKTKE